jgi:hypothetical protein
VVLSTPATLINSTGLRNPPALAQVVAQVLCRRSVDYRTDQNKLLAHSEHFDADMHDACIQIQVEIQDLSQHFNDADIYLQEEGMLGNFMNLQVSPI